MDVKGSKWTAGAGIGFFVLLVAGVITELSNAPDIHAKHNAAVVAAKVLHTFQSSGHRAGLIIGAYLLIVAAVVFVWFTAGLRAWLVAAGVAEAGIPRLVFGLGVLGASALVGAAMAWADVAGSFTFGGEPLPANPDTARLITDLGFPFVFVVFGLVSAGLIAAVSVAALRVPLLPRWLAYAGWLAVLGGILGTAFIPMILVPLWYLAVSIVGLVRPTPSTPPPAAAAIG